MSQFNDYYSNTGAGGGGFLPGGSPFSASGSPGGVRRTEASHSVRPLTAAQLIKATQAHTDAEWMIDDMEVGQVTIVGHVQSVRVQPTNCVYNIDDGTGRIEARHWTDSEDDAKWSGIQEHTYVRVTGGLKTHGSKRYINATHIRVTSDPHEVYYHILDAIAVNLTLERGPPGQSPPLKGGSSTTAISAYAAQSTSGGAADEFSNLPPLQRAIVRFILEQPPTAEGVHVAAIARSISKDGDARKISDALDKLMEEGHVYSTIDDSHFIVSR